MKNKIYSIIISISMLLMFSCNEKLKTSDEGYYFQDFDNLKMWAHDVNVSNEQAHSGSFSAYTDSAHEYSITFEMKYEYAKSLGYKGLQLNAWCYMTSVNSKAGIVTSIESVEKTPAYKKTDYREIINDTNKWVRIKAYLKFPDNVPDNSRIKVYVWSPDKQKAFLDDIEIEFEK